MLACHTLGHMKRVLRWAAGVTVVAAACTGGGLDLSDEQIQEIVVNGVNQTGRVDLTEDDWVRIAERACAEGAWDEGVQQAIVDDEDLDRRVPPRDAKLTVFLTAVTACREQFPEGWWD